MFDFMKNPKKIVKHLDYYSKIRRAVKRKMNQIPDSEMDEYVMGGWKARVMGIRDYYIEKFKGKAVGGE